MDSNLTSCDRYSYNSRLQCWSLKVQSMVLGNKKLEKTVKVLGLINVMTSYGFGILLEPLPHYNISMFKFLGIVRIMSGILMTDQNKSCDYEKNLKVFLLMGFKILKVLWLMCWKCLYITRVMILLWCRSYCSSGCSSLGIMKSNFGTHYFPDYVLVKGYYVESSARLAIP